MIKKGLYDPIFEHENCGAGFICSLNGIKSNDIINKALNILTDWSTEVQLVQMEERRWCWNPDRYSS